MTRPGMLDVPLPPVTLPVLMQVGDVPAVEFGTVTLTPGEDIRPALAALFREAADVVQAAELGVIE